MSPRGARRSVLIAAGMDADRWESPIHSFTEEERIELRAATSGWHAWRMCISLASKTELPKKGAVYKYPEQPLLGLSEPDRTLVRESLLRHMEKN